jgi:hypothetical protein
LHGSVYIGVYRLEAPWHALHGIVYIGVYRLEAPWHVNRQTDVNKPGAPGPLQFEKPTQPQPYPRSPGPQRKPPPQM